MKRHLYLLSALLGIIPAANAAPRTLAQMKAAAAQVLQTQAKKAKGLATTPTMADLKVLRQEQQLTVVGYEEGRYAVVANDDRFDAVLGYSDAPMGETPAPGFLWWLQAMDESLGRHLADGTPLKTTLPSGEQKESVGPLLTCQWGQGEPFYNMIPAPESRYGRYVTGCVATAMAQIMYCKRYPATGTGTHTYDYTDSDGNAMTFSANFGATTYDYDNMLDSYSSLYGYTGTEADAVATLMYHCGVAVDMQYETSRNGGSGTYLYKAVNGARDYLGFHKNIRYYWRNYTHEKEWMNIIYRELSDGCPLLAGGASGDYGHAFVFDGYDAEGRVHVNWGWEGYSDGFYEIPTLGGFSEQQQLVQMRPATDTRFDGDNQSYWVIESNLNMTASGNEIRVTADNEGGFFNMDPDIFNGYTGVAFNDTVHGGIVVPVMERSNAVAYANGYYVNCSTTTASLPNGVYRVFLASRSNDDTEWQPAHAHESTRNCYIMEKDDTGITLTPGNDDTWTVVTAIDRTAGACAQGTKAETTRVYSSDGQLLLSCPTRSFSPDQVTGHGIFIVKQGADTRKVVKP